MCNKLNLNINSVSQCGIRYGWLPCGKCAACRAHKRSEWVFRLRVELDKLCDKGWKIGFFTLTYNEKSLPKIPAYFFKSKYKPTMCFDKNDIRTFIVKLKNWLKKEYSAVKRYRYHRVKGVVVSKTLLFDDAPRFMVCSEFGEHTQRSHYHGIICFPPKVPAEALFNKILELWRGEVYADGKDCKGKGWVFPKEFNGGLDSHGYLHKPFLCDSTKAAAVYAAKYVCKDLAYLDHIKSLELRKEFLQCREYVDLVDCGLDPFDGAPLQAVEKGLDLSEVVVDKLSNYMPFHYQSKSIGLSFLDGLSDAQKLSYLKDGFGFVGDDRHSPLPIYLKNKILFTPKYIYDENGKRLVRREATEFFRSNLSEIWDKKVNDLTEQFSQLSSLNFWISIGATKKDLEQIKIYSSCITDAHAFAESYLAWYGVDFESCYNVPPMFQWFARYDENFCLSDARPMDSDFLICLTEIVNNLFTLFVKYDVVLNLKRSKDEREIARIYDYWVSQE